MIQPPEIRLASDTERTEPVRPVEVPVSAGAEANRLSRHILNTFHSARKAYADDQILDRLMARFRRLAAAGELPGLQEMALSMLNGLMLGTDANYAPRVTVRYEGSGPVRVILETHTLRIPEGAHALVADLWYAAPDWSKSYPEAVRHATVQLPPDAGMAAFEFFPEKNGLPYVLVAGLRWHLDFRHRDNFSRQPGASNAIITVLG